MRYDFIEIGISDFRTLAHTVAGTGISVEPVPEYFNRLPNYEGLTKVNKAISDTQKEVDLYFCKSDVVRKLGLPEWLRGCNSIIIEHPSVKTYCEENDVDYDDLVDCIKVQCITIGDLFKENEVEEVSFLKIDTEGHDYYIVKSLFEF